MARLRTLRREHKRNFARFERYAYNRTIRFLRVMAENYTAPITPDKFQELYLEIYGFIGRETAKSESRRIEKDVKSQAPESFFLRTWERYIQAYVKGQLGLRITQVADRTKALVAEEISKAAIEGIIAVRDIQKRVQAVIADPKRARAIARTETTLAMSLGKEATIQTYQNELGFQLYKVWIHSGAANERPEHVALQGIAVPVESTWEVEGKPMKYPGDPAGGASQVVNCQCTYATVSERQARANFRLS